MSLTRTYLLHNTIIKLVSEEEDIFLSYFLSTKFYFSCPLFFFFILLLFSPLTLLILGSFRPVASAAIVRFKWLLTGSARDLWLHLSLTWNPLPSGLFSTSPTHSILFPVIVLSGPPPSVLCLPCAIISFSSVCSSI